MPLDVSGRALICALARRRSLRRRLARGLLTLPAALLVTATAAAAYSPTPIITNGSWSPNPCCGARHPGWFPDAFGIVHLEGAVSQLVIPGGTPLITTLPPAARPNRTVFEIVHTFGGTYADISIDTSGRVAIIAPRPPEIFDPSFVSLESVSYQRTNRIPVQPINVNLANWVQNWGPQVPSNPNNSFGASNPGWYKDGAGIVHLQGATKQWNNAGNSATLIGTLPPQAAPGRNLVVLAHTFRGTYALLNIDATGRIFALGTSAPGTTDYSFVSLEGISYQPDNRYTTIDDINTIDWHPCFGVGQDIGWVQDSANIVHLRGCVSQLSTSSRDPNLIGSLPPAIAPSQTVYVIAEAGAGQYADLAIAPDGTLRVVGTPPATDVLSVLRLDGITYQPTDASGPRALTLTRSGEVLALLRKPRRLELAVFKLGPRAHKLGTVKLGSAPAGRSRFHWNLRVGGHRLTRGTYIAELLVAPGGGRSPAGGPGVQFTVSGGRLQVLFSTCSVSSALRHGC